MAPLDRLDLHHVADCIPHFLARVRCFAVHGDLHGHHVRIKDWQLIAGHQSVPVDELIPPRYACLCIEYDRMRDHDITACCLQITMLKLARWKARTWGLEEKVGPSSRQVNRFQNRPVSSIELSGCFDVLIEVHDNDVACDEAN